VIVMRVDLPDGRRLEVVVAGPEHGMPLVFHYGTPSSAVPYPPMVDAAAARGLRSVIYSRPGYGDSTERPGRTVAAAAVDTAAILDHLDAGEFVTVGWSGGGPHALACAALLPGRCLAAASIAGVAPYGAAGLDWTAGMGAENVEEFHQAAAGVQALTAYLETYAAGLATIEGRQVAAALETLISDVDRRQLTGEFADFVAATFRGAVANGIAGWRDDDLAFLTGWGFPLADCRQVAIWQGRQDLMVPYAHAEWLAAHLPGVHARLLPEDGHLSLLVGAFDRILEDLLALAANR
jgi:pimeloyl-ACP methyl ester carboxylesterase